MYFCNFDIKFSKKLFLLSLIASLIFISIFRFRESTSVPGDLGGNGTLETIDEKDRVRFNLTKKFKNDYRHKNHKSKEFRRNKRIGKIALTTQLWSGNLDKKTSRFEANTRLTTTKHDKKSEDILNAGDHSFSAPLPNKYPPNVRIVNHTGVFLQRLARYNDVVSEVRRELLHKRGTSPWKDVQPPNQLEVVDGSSDTFFEELTKISSLQIVLLPWLPRAVASNVLHTDYFKWTASDQLCNWIETEGFTKARWDAVYNKTCNRDFSLSQHSSPLESMYLYGKPINPSHYWPNDGTSYPHYFFHQPPPYSLYLTILQDAVVNLNGDVISGKYKIVPYTCSHDSLPTVPQELLETPIYTEVFVITQFWGAAYFHRIVEVLPRLAPYTTFLKQHPSILIHAPEEFGMTADLMEVLGVGRDRLVSGIVRAKTLYLPQATPCGFPHLASTQVLSHLFNQYIHNNLSAEYFEIVEKIGNKQKLLFEDSSSSSFQVLQAYSKRYFSTSQQPLTTSRNRLVLVQRSGSRKFLHAQQIAKSVFEFSKHHHLDFFLFRDDPSPNLHSTMVIFNSALIIVAPHGAGLANSIFAQTGTLVIEGVCNPPHVNMCFQFLSYVTALRYHGIPSKHGCEGHIDVTPAEILKVLQEYVGIFKTFSKS